MNYVVSLFTRSPRSLRLRVFALAHALLLLPLVLSAQIVEFPYTYTVSGGKATITGFDHSYYSSHSGDLSIASELGGYPVTAIGDWVFFWHSPLTSVTIPNSVTHIGQEAFHRCPILTAVLFTGDAPDTGWHTFYDTPATVYYLPGKNGWTSSTFAGRPAVCWNPVFSSASPASGAFNLTLSGNANASLTVYIEASESLTSPDWVILDRITIPAGGTVTFTDTDFGTYPSRFYRVTLP
ncbi:MAG TPA: leucine-rich repeat protein [Candidatus Latescibacteria bacterium]|nr:leucine-rich repeat protein [Candidatus Latescibacterota bacterium]